jgi:glucose 1-dehydrogenase
MGLNISEKTMSVLKGKRAVISGSSRGIGRGIAVQFAKAGAEVVVNYNSHPDEAEQVVQCCRQQGVEAHKVQANLAEQSQVEALIDESVRLMGGLDIVVSNAAYSDRHLMLESDLEEFRKTIDISMWGAFHLVRRGAEQMVAAGNGGNIIVVSSPHAHMAMPGAMAYNMAKAANDQMARTAAVELAHHQIRVNIIHPGWTDTPGERKFFTEETLATEGAKIPMGRLGKPEELGRAAVFLCDPESQYITGSTLTVDGGIQLPWREMYRIDEPV